MTTQTTLPPETEKKERCPTCGCPVDSIFDHVDECPPEPDGGYPATTFFLPRNMTDKTVRPNGDNK